MKSQLTLTAFAGLAAALIVGTGEYLLHYDAFARFSEGGYDFMQGIPEGRATLGHFLGVFGATLYPVGCYHIYLMLRPASQRLAFTAFLVGSFGFMIGVVWIGSRASISALVQLPPSPEIVGLMQLYELRYEPLLQVIRLTTLILSLVVVILALSGRSHYPKWMAILNPFVLIIMSFLIFAVSPGIGKHMMPIALNIAFFVFFLFSLVFARRVEALPS